jgi:hypothetical protein
MLWKAITFLGFVSLIVAASSPETRAAVGGPAVTVVPCPDAPWQRDDAIFEALPGARAVFGEYEGGLYRIEIPDAWNGELVLLGSWIR